MTPDTSTTAHVASAAPSTGCCPRFDPSQWDRREIVWQDKPFVKSHVRSLLHIPINFGSKVVEAKALIDAAHAAPEHPIMLVDEKSPWGSDLYIDAKGPVPGAEMATMSGRFLTRVFEGPYREAPHWAAEMKAYVAGRGRTLEKLYFAYTTCPACAKAYGQNYVVVFAKVSEPS